MCDLAQVHRTRTARQLFGQQPEAADRLGGLALRLSVGIGSLGFGSEELFVFVEKIKAHFVSLLLPPRYWRGQKSRPNQVHGPGGGLVTHGLLRLAHSR